ncbi:deoxyribodipyrimidine photo-lyase/cryptochrome family protein [Marine Group III euryarchaeote]|nr:deoxyribodipyrimidine photo-lyase/cryptochrome family protein [Marine Group III euryarchaeote]
MRTGIIWFRNALRLNDNRVLVESLKSTNSETILPIYILDKEALTFKNNNNRIKFLYESLIDLDAQFKAKFGSNLTILNGNSEIIFRKLLENDLLDISEIFTDYSNKPDDVKKVNSLQRILSKNTSVNLRIISKVNTLTNIEKVTNQENFKPPKTMKDMEKLFSNLFPKDENGFYGVDEPLDIPEITKSLPDNYSEAIKDYIFDAEEELSLFKKDSKSYFKGGESEALVRLEKKVSSEEEYIRNFRKPRTTSTNDPENPLEPETTGLSPYLSFGCLSPRLLWKETEKCYRNGEHFQPPESMHGQLLFREMFYLLSKSVENWDSDTNNSMCKKIEWGAYDSNKMELWEKGETGFPYIDAMMRQLDATGWMHHLGRHAVSCFLTRGQLWQHWELGRDVFDRKLVDADWALNNGNWLWLAGVAPFSMPYFRLYSPCPDGKSSLNIEAKNAEFIRYWVPELKDFSSKYIFEPHLAPLPIQESASCVIGKDYPEPMVDRKVVAKENLAKFKESLAKLK